MRTNLLDKLFIQKLITDHCLMETKAPQSGSLHDAYNILGLITNLSFYALLSSEQTQKTSPLDR